MTNRKDAVFVTTSANFTAEQTVTAVTAFINQTAVNALHGAAVASKLDSVRFIERDEHVAVTADLSKDELRALAGFVEAFQTMSNATREVRVGFIVGAHNFPIQKVA